MSHARASLVVALLALALPAAARGDEPGREPPSEPSEPTLLQEPSGAAPSHARSQLGAGADPAAAGLEVQPLPVVETQPSVTPAAGWSPVLFVPLDPQAGC